MAPLALSTLLLLAAPGMAAAQAPAAAPQDKPAPTAEEPVVLDELVVRGKSPGPAWWRVIKGESVVFILGLPEALPKDMLWDQSVLERRLKGADRLITPPRLSASINLFLLPKLLWDMNGASRTKTALAARVPPTLLKRLDAAAMSIGGSADDYRSRPTWVAGLRLAIDHDRRAGLETREPLHAIREAARKAGVKIEPAHVTATRASNLVDEVKSVSEASGQACLEAAVSDVEGGDEAVRTVAAAWAKGDLRTVLHQPRPFPRCFAMLKSVREDRQDATAQEVDAVKAALVAGTPGQSVAAFPLRSLVVKGGVLDQLREQGFKVLAPE